MIELSSFATASEVNAISRLGMKYKLECEMDQQLRSLEEPYMRYVFRFT